MRSLIFFYSELFTLRTRFRNTNSFVSGHEDRGQGVERSQKGKSNLLADRGEDNQVKCIILQRASGGISQVSSNAGAPPKCYSLPILTLQSAWLTDVASKETEFWRQ